MCSEKLNDISDNLNAFIQSLVARCLEYQIPRLIYLFIDLIVVSCSTQEYFKFSCRTAANIMMLRKLPYARGKRETLCRLLANFPTKAREEVGISWT